MKSLKAAPSPRSARWSLIAAAAVVALVAGCGSSSGNESNGAGAGSEPASQVSETTSPGDSPEISDFDGGAVIGSDGYQGPDWMDSKMAVLLPVGLTVTIDQQDPTTGSAVLTGFVTDGDVDELLGDAKFMVRAGGYFVGEDFDNGASKGFAASVGVKDLQIFFGVSDTTTGEVRWSMEFSNSESDSEAADD